MNLALALGAVHHAKVLALYVNDPYPNIGVGSVNPMGYSACMDSVKKRASEIHQQFTQAAHTLAPSLPIECLLLEDTAVSEGIVQTSQDQRCDLVPPPRTHRHRYFGVLAPHSPLRAAVVALAAGQTAGAGRAQHEPVGVSAKVDETVNPMGVATVGAPSQPEPAQPALPKSQAHDLRAVLIARICEVFPRVCPISASVGEARQQHGRGAQADRGLSRRFTCHRLGWAALESTQCAPQRSLGCCCKANGPNLDKTE